jgi:hypothetical protein
MVMVFDRMTQEECDGEKKQVVIEAISEGLEEKSKDVGMKQEGKIEASVDIVNKESEDNAEVKPE